jgi:hypothetical protein
MTFKSATSSFVDMLASNHVTSSSINPPTFKHVTSFSIHALTFKHLLSSTCFFKHWTSPFKEIRMALKQTKKTRHRDNYALLPFQTLKTLKPVISSYYQTMHIFKRKHEAKLGIAPKLVHFQILSHVFFPLSIFHLMFFMVHCVFHEHMVFTLVFFGLYG